MKTKKTEKYNTHLPKDSFKAWKIRHLKNLASKMMAKTIIDTISIEHTKSFLKITAVAINSTTRLEQTLIVEKIKFLTESLRRRK